MIDRTEDIHDEPEAAPCPACGDERISILGLLGRRMHVRCRACGLDRSMEADELSSCELGEHLDTEDGICLNCGAYTLLDDYEMDA